MGRKCGVSAGHSVLRAVGQIRSPAGRVQPGHMPGAPPIDANTGALLDLFMLDASLLEEVTDNLCQLCQFFCAADELATQEQLQGFLIVQAIHSNRRCARVALRVRIAGSQHLQLVCAG